MKTNTDTKPAADVGLPSGALLATPRTDAHLKAQVHTYSPAVDPDFARELERENVRLRDALERMLYLCEHDLGMDNESPYIALANAAMCNDFSG